MENNANYQFYNYADYNFYTTSYKGSLSSILFNHFITEASIEIRNYINREITQEVLESLNDEDKFLLQYTACQLCDFLNKEGTPSSKKGEKSISIDGVSISGDTNGNSYENNKAKILSNLPQVLIRYL